jgi:hypothetical protein
MTMTTRKTMMKLSESEEKANIEFQVIIKRFTLS